MSFWRQSSTTTKVILILILVIVIAFTVLILNRTGVISLGGGSDAGTSPGDGETALVIPTPAPGSPSLITNTEVNIRNGPGSEYDSIGLLKQGQSAQVVGVNSDRTWWAINITSPDHEIGWVAGQYVTTSNTDNVPVIEPQVTPSPSPQGTPTPSGTPLITATVDTPLYSGPGDEFTIIARLLAGQSAEVTGVSLDAAWWQIVIPNSEGARGWVITTDVIAENIENVPVVDPDVEPTADVTAAPGTGATLAADTNVNIRNGPGIQFEAVGLLEQGITAEVIGVNVNRSWWMIIIPDTENLKGWVSDGFVTTENTGNVPTVDKDGNPLPGQLPIPTPGPGSPSVTSQINLNIRSGPGIGFEIIGLLLQGQSAGVLGVSQDGSWWAINIPSADKGRGWVSADYVTAENTDGVPVIEGP
jgi:uncharacterized protein YraI